jgi:hypothetical protein
LICGDPSLTPVEWATPTTGTAGAIDISVADLGSPSPSRWELTGSDFAAAPLCPTAQSIDHATGSDWTVTPAH